MSNSSSPSQTAARPAPKPATPWWKHWWVLLAAVVAIAVVIVLVPGRLLGSGTPSVAITSTPPPEQAWEALISQYATDFGINWSSDWNGVVNGRAVTDGTQLWIYTKLPADAASKKTATDICAKYSKFPLMAPMVTTVYVAAATGEPVAQCTKS